MWVLHKNLGKTQNFHITTGTPNLSINLSLSLSLQSSSVKSAGKPGLLEYLFCEVTSPVYPPIFAGVVYRPPHAPFTAGEDIYFITDLMDSMHKYRTKAIMGDFDADQLSTSADALFIKNLISDNALQSVYPLVLPFIEMIQKRFWTSA